ncbi:MAG: MipA/OmpV family protein [Erythrobacter sp.]
MLKIIGLFAVGAAGCLAAPQAWAQAADEANSSQGRPASSEAAGPPEVRGGPPPGVLNGPNVFDGDWITLGLGVSASPSYSGSDDYVVFPVPLIRGRIAGIGINPSAAGLTLDFVPKPQNERPGQRSVSFSAGPTFRFRSDRSDRIRDEVVIAAGELENAVELGASAGVTIPGVLSPIDSISFSTDIRFDVAGAHEGMLIEPGVTYFTPMGQSAAISLSAGLSFVDDDFADYYYSVDPAQSAASGLPEFTADGGLNSVGVNALFAFDFDGNVLNGGIGAFMITGYSRLIGDAADTPFTSIRGNPDQIFGAIGLAYTF